MGKSAQKVDKGDIVATRNAKYRRIQKKYISSRVSEATFGTFPAASRKPRSAFSSMVFRCCEAKGLEAC